MQILSVQGSAETVEWIGQDLPTLHWDGIVTLRVLLDERLEALSRLHVYVWLVVLAALVVNFISEVAEFCHAVWTATDEDAVE